MTSGPTQLNPQPHLSLSLPPPLPPGGLRVMALGAVGVVSVVGHLVGPRLAELVAAVESGDLVKARAVNESLLPVYTGVFRTQGTIMVKAALRELGLPAGPVRPPLVDATPEQLEQLRMDLAAGGVTL